MPALARSCKQPVAGVQWLHTDTSLKFYEYHYHADDTQLDYHRMSPHRLSRERRAEQDARQAFYGL